MSNSVNEQLLERAAETIDLAHEHQEFWLSTPMGKMLDKLVAQVVKNIDDNNLEDLHAFNLPALERGLRQSAINMAEYAQEEMKARDLGV